MNLDSKFVQQTIQSLLTDMKPNVLAIPNISNVLSNSQNSSKSEHPRNKDNHNNKTPKKNKNTYKPRTNNHVYHIADMLYEKLNTASVELSAEKNDGCLRFQESVIDIHSQIPHPETFSEKFISREIKECIKNDSRKLLTFECKINKRDIRLFFVLFKHHSHYHNSSCYYKNYARRVFIWLQMISLKSSCIESLDIYVYLTPFKKQLPANNNEAIGTINANTGYTYRCEKKNEIVIYREEEWFKVFLHETLHAFGSDFEKNDNDEYISMVNLRKIFSLPQEINIQLSETYSEIWARIINVAFQTYFKDPPSLESRTAEQFKKNFGFYLNLESIFSLYQCIKILDFMGINYQVLIDDSEHSKKMMHSFYRENTHVFAYYVLTSILLHSHDEFFSWCIKKNGPGLDIFKVKAKQHDFATLVASCYKKNDLLQKIVETEKKVARDYDSALSLSEKSENQLISTLRMTVVGFD